MGRPFLFVLLALGSFSGLEAKVNGRPTRQKMLSRPSTNHELHLIPGKLTFKGAALRYSASKANGLS